MMILKKTQKKEIFLIVGLGNPGKEFKNTPHNLGFEVLDIIKKKYGFFKLKASEKKFQGEIFEKNNRENKILLLKPQTFMNNSGIAVKKVVDFFKIKTQNILLVYDDLNIDFGKIKFKKGGRSGGHKGVESIIDSLKTNELARIKIGTGPISDQLKKEFVLKKFDEENQKIINKVKEEAVDKIKTIIKF